MAIKHQYRREDSVIVICLLQRDEDKPFHTTEDPLELKAFEPSKLCVHWCGNDCVSVYSVCVCVCVRACVRACVCVCVSMCTV